MTLNILLRTYLQRAPVTLAIAVACVVVSFGEGVNAGAYNFVAGSGRSLSPLLAFGVLSQPAVADGEWWRLITAGFLHFGIIHLLLNMYALLVVGLFIEPLYGRWRYGVIYAISLLAGDVVADLTQGPLAVSAGASGAIMGAFGAMAVVGLRYQIARRYLRSALFPIGATLLFGLANPGISNAAHLGGLVGGSAVALLLNLPPEVVRRVRAAQEQAAARVPAVDGGATPHSGWPAEVVDDPANRRELRATGSSGPRRRVLAAALGLGGLVLLGAALLGLIGGDSLAAWQPLAAIGGLILLAWAYELGRPSRDVLILSPRGFSSEGRFPMAVRWRDVRGFGLATLGNGRTAVVFTRVPSESPAGASTGASSPAVEILPMTYGLAADELAALLEQWRARWARSDRGSIV